MPYARDTNHLEQLIHQAAETEEIVKWLPRSGLGLDDLEDRIAKDANRIWAAGAEQIAEFDTIEARIAAVQREGSKAAPGPPPLLRMLKGTSHNAPAPITALVDPLVHWLDSGYQRSVARFIKRYENSSRVPELLKRRNEAASRADEAVIRAGIIPVMRGIINQAMRKS